MATKRTSPSEKEYCVIAECSRLVYQNVMATSREEAHRIAGENRDGWDSEMDCEDGDYRLWDSVQDVRAQKLIRVRELPATYCKTCGSEIVDSVNDGAFRDGECNACEYYRYQTQPELIDAIKRMKAAIDDMLADESLDLPSECGDLLVQIAQMGCSALGHTP